MYMYYITWNLLLEFWIPIPKLIKASLQWHIQLFDPETLICNKLEHFLSWPLP